MKAIDKFLVVWKKVQIFLLYVIAILIVFWMYPREGKFQYEYVKNRPWKHQDLIAPFDFPVYKDDAQIEAETDSITKTNIPYFTLDSAVEADVNAELESDLASDASRGINIAALKPYQRRIVDTLPGLLDHVYKVGIIEMNPVIQQADPVNGEVMLLKGQMAEETPLSSLFTEKKAYEYMLRVLKDYTLKSESEILSRFTLAKYIEPNLMYDEPMTRKVLEAKLDGISTTQGMVQSGQIIIARGELVSPSKYRLVESLRKEYETNSNVYKNYTLLYLGQFILISILFLSLLWYVSNFRKDMMGSAAQTLFLLSMIVIMVGLTNVTVNNEAISYYVIPETQTGLKTT